mgnify:CR=1 FL=1
MSLTSSGGLVSASKAATVAISPEFFSGPKNCAITSAMSNTKRKFFGRFWKTSKYIEDDYKEDLEKILEKYSEKGYRDARILNDKLTWNEDNTINLDIYDVCVEHTLKQ